MMSAGLSLKPSNLPEKGLVYANCVYASKGDFCQLCGSFDGRPAYVDIKGYIFTIKVHSGVAPGDIAIGKVQREYARIGVGTEVFVKHFVPPPAFDLGSCKCEIDFFLKPTAQDSRVEVMDEEIEAIFRKRFENQVLAMSQMLILDFEGNVLKLKVSGLTPIDLGSGSVPTKVPLGMFSSMSELELQQGPSGKLHVLSNKVQHRTIFRPDFNFEELGIGGLSKEFGDIFRRAFAARTFPPSVVRDLGIHHVRGMLLHGPPGTGKTLIARQLAKFLKAAEPKIVNGPEILDKYVGKAEENIRNLFADAEKEYKIQGEQSQLHVIIFDEIDSICKARGTAQNGTGVHDSIVNQLLSKIDGVDSLNNILLIGMTNRMDLIDEALLRPGRLEVHVEISLPNEAGRVEILNIHTKNMSSTGYLDSSVSIPALAARTKNFAGAEIEGLIRSATSFALNRQVDVSDPSKTTEEGQISVTMEDFENGLLEVTPLYGQHTDEFEMCTGHGITPYSMDFEKVLRNSKNLIDQVRCSENTPLLTVLLHGSPGCGKSALSAHLARFSDYPLVRRLAAENFIGYSEQAKVAAMTKVFHQAYKSPLSLVVLDDIERLVDYVRVGPRFNNPILQAMFAFLKTQPPKVGRRLLVIGTTSEPGFLKEVDLFRVFNVALEVPVLTAPEHFKVVLQALPGYSPPVVDEIQRALIGQPIGIKTLLLIAEMAVQRQNPVLKETFMECVDLCL